MDVPKIREQSEEGYRFACEAVDADHWVTPRATFPIEPTALLLRVRSSGFVQLQLVVVRFTHLVQPDLKVRSDQAGTHVLALEPGESLTAVGVQSTTCRFGTGVYLMLYTTRSEAGKKFTTTHQRTISVRTNSTVVH